MTQVNLAYISEIIYIKITTRMSGGQAKSALISFVAQLSYNLSTH